MKNFDFDTLTEHQVLQFAHPDNWASNIPGVPNDALPHNRVVNFSGLLTWFARSRVIFDLKRKMQNPERFSVQATFGPSKHTSGTIFASSRANASRYLAIDHEHLTYNPERPFSAAEFEETIPAARQELSLGDSVYRVGERATYAHFSSLAQVVSMPTRVRGMYALTIACTETSLQRDTPTAIVKFLPSELSIGQVHQAECSLLRINRIDVLDFNPAA